MMQRSLLALNSMNPRTREQEQEPENKNKIQETEKIFFVCLFKLFLTFVPANRAEFHNFG